MKILRRALASSAFLLCAALARATSILPPTFPDLVTEADTIVRGTVTDVHCVAVETSRGQAIHTLVTLRVERAIKGAPGETLTLTILGGTVGKRTLAIDGLPQFRVGERTLVFLANNGRTMCPVIGARHGRFNIEHDAGTGRDYVTRDNGRPLISLDDVALPFAPAALNRTVTTANAVALGAFEASIASALQNRAPVARPN